MTFVTLPPCPAYLRYLPPTACRFRCWLRLNGHGWFGRVASACRARFTCYLPACQPAWRSPACAPPPPPAVLPPAADSPPRCCHTPACLPAAYCLWDLRRRFLRRAFWQNRLDKLVTRDACPRCQTYRRRGFCRVLPCCTCCHRITQTACPACPVLPELPAPRLRPPPLADTTRLPLPAPTTPMPPLGVGLGRGLHFPPFATPCGFLPQDSLPMPAWWFTLPGLPAHLPQTVPSACLTGFVPLPGQVAWRTRYRVKGGQRRDLVCLTAPAID